VACSFLAGKPSPRATLQYAPPITLPGLLDLELLHNFTTKTYATANSSTAISPQLAEFYRTTFVQHAFAQDFFIHSILALSAFHLEYLNYQRRDTAAVDKYAIAAHTHQNTALRSFRQTLPDITSENCHGVFACSFLMCLMSFASSHPRQRANLDNNTPSSPTPESLLQTVPWLPLVRGILPALLPGYAHVMSGPLGPILCRVEDNPSTRQPLFSLTACAQLDELSAVLTSSSDPQLACVCIKAVATLRQTWSGTGKCTYTPISFLTETDDDFFAYFCVSLRELGSYWWVEGWPEFLLERIAGLVHEENLRALLLWPTAIVYGDNFGIVDENLRKSPVSNEGIGGVTGVLESGRLLQNWSAMIT